ncbi:hypothetical protein BU24DRAFT_460188 [Aaosphaeria arxii CBS 175.79]|uniref:Extracellular membrane protein CFEM domain-containing protein n=1 Tax=Aaosphaeria arxii CBS 175.79 TaxID=1450172 RepID=A0A6A5XVV7_9PLEO|nr:uncharacterized protein BU24DRAFT_460188 [Aaosphaeria arxii CBS 175.79]KAF2017099.1 hypothetical protein BU24DRAFT_460188 [Aaosphaeria arxii CBS 175.79]
MSSIDGTYSPFKSYPGFSSMAPCMRACDENQGFNGCDQARCWCTKPNLDLYMTGMARCASSRCTFQNMNTQTDLDLASGVHVEYCADRGFSPAGMTLPSTAEANPTASSDPFTTNGPLTTGSETRSRPTSGPTSTSTNPPNTNTSTNTSSGGMTVATKAGIAIGAAFCVLLLIVIVLLLRRRRHKTQFYPQPPPPQNQNPSMLNNFPNGGAPMAPTPYSNHGPFNPPPLQQPSPLHIPQQHQQQQIYPSYTKGDVSPIEEKAPPFPATTSASAIPRKEISTTSVSKEITSNTTPSSVSPTLAAANVAATGPTEIQGDDPPPRHEIPTDGEITNTVTTRGMELDASQRPSGYQYSTPPPGAGAELPANPQHQGGAGYQQSGQGQWGHYQQQQQYPSGAHEVPGGQNQWPRQEMDAGGQQQQQGWGQRYEVDGGQNQWGSGQRRHELGG